MMNKLLIDSLSTEAGKKEFEFIEEKLNPSEEQLRMLEDELNKINEKKFGSLVETQVPDEIIKPEKKILTYARRDA